MSLPGNMNIDVYLFGDLGDGYTQYIDDNNRILFKSIASKSKANSQLIIHRDNTLMYYTYIRRLRNSESSNGRYIGISYVLNNHFIRDIDGLFDIFEGAITTIVSRGILLEYTNNGNIIATIGKIYNAKSEFAHISSYLKNELDMYMAGRNDKLPPLDYSINTSEYKTFNFNDSRNEIISALSTFSTIYIFKDDNYENAESRSYANKLKRNNEEIKTLTSEIFNLKVEILKLKRQKKQFAVVIILIIIIAIGLMIFISKINDKNEIIKRKNAQIEALEKYRDQLKADSVNLTNELSSTKDTLKLTKKTLERLRADYANLETKKNELYTECEKQKQTINSLKNEKSTLESTIATLKSRINNNNSSSHSSTSYSTGASKNKSSLNKHDKHYALWLYATQLLKINNFSLYPSKSGYITIGLYKSSGYLVATCRSYVYANQWNMISPSGFDLNPNTDYYMAIKDANGIELTWHETSSNEYSKYQTGPLRIKGYSKKGETSIGTKYYQYFYEINYTTR